MNFDLSQGFLIGFCVAIIYERVMPGRGIAWQLWLFPLIMSVTLVVLRHAYT